MPFGLRFYTFLWITLSNSWLPFMPLKPSTFYSTSSSSSSAAAPSTSSSSSGIFYYHNALMGAEAQPSSLTEKIPLGKWGALKQVLKNYIYLYVCTSTQPLLSTHSHIHIITQNKSLLNCWYKWKKKNEKRNGKNVGIKQRIGSVRYTSQPLAEWHMCAIFSLMFLFLLYSYFSTLDFHLFFRFLPPLLLLAATGFYTK